MTLEPPATEGLADLLRVMRDKGVRLWAEQGSLRYQAPRGSMTPDERQLLQSHKREIIALLDPNQHSLPLTFSQHWWWKLHGHAMKRSVILLRLSGAWRIPMLEAAFSTMLRRHDGLRMTISVRDGVPRQEKLADEERQFETIHFDALPEADREGAAKRFVTTCCDEEGALSGTPAFRVRILVLGTNEQLLFISWSHLFFDAVSLNLFWYELWTLYLQTSESAQLPERPVQFSDYLLDQQQLANEWLATHARFWKQSLEDVNVPRLSMHESPGATTSAYSEVAAQLSVELMERVRTVSQSERTSAGILLLAALIVAIRQWCDQEEIVVCCATTCRTTPDLQSMIGFASSTIFVRVKIASDDRFGDVIRRVTEQYMDGIQHDVSGGLLDQPPFPDLERCVLFNYFPRELVMNAADRFHSLYRERTSTPLTIQPLCWVTRNEEYIVRFVGQRELCFSFLETQGEARAVATSRSERLSRSAVARFLGSFESLLTSMLSDPSAHISGIAR